MVLKARPVKGYIRHEGGKPILVAPHLDPRDPAHQKQVALRALAKDTDLKLGPLYEQHVKLEDDLRHTQEDIQQNPTRYPPGGFRLKNATAHIEEVTRKRDAVMAQTAPLNMIFDRHQWSRFFLVTNQNGHVHSSRSCATTFPTTQWAWLAGPQRGQGAGSRRRVRREDVHGLLPLGADRDAPARDARPCGGS